MIDSVANTITVLRYNGYFDLANSLSNLKDHIEGLVAERDALRVEKRRLAADKDRLDWLDCNVRHVDFVVKPDALVEIWCGTYPPKNYLGTTVRDAIDAARKQEGERLLHEGA